MHSISTRALSGRVLTAKVARAGGSSGKYLPASNALWTGDEGCFTFHRKQNSKMRTIHGVDGRKVVHAGQQDCGFDNLAKVAACSLEHGPHVAHNLLCLTLNPGPGKILGLYSSSGVQVLQLHTPTYPWNQAQLARHEYHVTGLDSLAVGTEGSRCLVGGDDLLLLPCRFANAI